MKIEYKSFEIESGYTPRKNLYLGLEWSGSSTIGVALPIRVVVETRDD